MRTVVQAMTALVIAAFLADGSPAQHQIRNTFPPPGTVVPFQRGQIFICDQASNKIHVVDPVTFQTQALLTAANGLSSPSAVQFTVQNRLLVANFASNQLMEFDQNLTGSTVLDAADGLSGPGGSNGITLDSFGRVFVSNATTHQVLRFNADYQGGVNIADSNKGLGLPEGLAVNAKGEMIVASIGCSGVLVKLDIAGNPSLFDTLFLEDPQAIAVRANRDLYVLCLSGNLYRYQLGSPTVRTLLGNYGVPGAPASLEFDPDSTVLYHVNSASGELRTIDPSTGASRVVVTRPWDAVSMAVLGSQFAHGSFEFVGQGTAGTGGVVPFLAAAGTPRIGATFTLQVRDFVGGVPSLALFGNERTSVPIFGGTLLIDLTGIYQFRPVMLPGNPGGPGEGDVDLLFGVPNFLPLTGLRFYAQQFAFDAGAPQGLAMTNAICVFLGE